MVIGIYLVLWLAIALGIWLAKRKKSSIERMKYLLGIVVIEPVVTIIMLLLVYPVLLRWVWRENLISVDHYHLVNTNALLQTLLPVVSVVIGLLPCLLLFDEQAVVRKVAWQAGLMVLGRWLYLLMVRNLLAKDFNPWLDMLLIVSYLVLLAITIYIGNALLIGRLDRVIKPVPVETEPLFQGQPIVYADLSQQPMIYLDPPKDQER
ncbi:hypothetical protein [Herpetosiphon geysericola]|uniref:Uncharacterized protein n=1 Tax=Herpetosiphon geysericola TaxID=70996 RepID=A0A0P6Y3H3_9CHLR|nr:hypothetical protein [Herpetosiphon geysericola]KPL83672.1 hypothetical protein SE18_19020 [Herpetosiphon geysericola]